MFQNVLKQIGLNIVSLDGRVIKHLRTFILRCYSCFKTTSNMTKVFCPKCGNKTLKKVAVSVDENGQQVIHINPRKPLTARGKRVSIILWLHITETLLHIPVLANRIDWSINVHYTPESCEYPLHHSCHWVDWTP